MLPPKTSHRAKFHRDRSNQLGEKRYRNWASDKKNYFVTDGQKRDYLSRTSQRARGATNKPCQSAEENNTALSDNMKNYHFVEFGDWYAKHQRQLWRWKQGLKARVEVRHQVDGERLTHAREVIQFLDGECSFVNPDTLHQLSGSWIQAVKRVQSRLKRKSSWN